MNMDAAAWLTVLNILIAFWGVFIVGVTIFEFGKLRELRKQLEGLRQEIREDLYKTMKASHRVLASYAVANSGEKITLLKSALDIEPTVFNGFNALGYAYLEQGDTLKAVDAFKDAIRYHPKDKSGYCDLAYAYLELKDITLCLSYLSKAIQTDPSARQDIKSDPRFSSLDLTKLS